ncbi:MAG TPA: hypothetical protein PLY35_08995 [Thermotogota bacterium]|nr:hypothetical protein [Thermotogota bacterium]
MPNNIKYLSKDYESIKSALVDFTKYSFPEYKDFNEASVGMMFIKQLSYFGDMLSFYIDNQMLETFQDYAQLPFNIINNAKMMGYKPRLVSASQTQLQVSQLIPANPLNNWEPDYRYALKINNLEAKADTYNVNFISNSSIDFSYPDSIEIFSNDESNLPATYILTKNVDAFSGIIKQYDYNISTSEKYLKIIIPDTNILAIQSIIDSSGNVWYETPYLSNDLIFDTILTKDDPVLSEYKDDVPFLLRYKKVTKRFVTGYDDSLNFYVQFGAGTNQFSDEILLPNPSLQYTYFTQPSGIGAILNTRTFGEVPYNTTLTIKYIKGYENGNVPANSIKTISNSDIISNYNFTGEELDIFNGIKSGIQITNITSAIASIQPETPEEIKLNSKAYFSAQDRCVTIPDYEARILSMPGIYGGVKKVKILTDANTSTLNAYCLTLDRNKNLTNINDATIHNLINYLNYYRMASDSINIQHAYIINIGVNFEIIVKPNIINKNEVLLNCILELKKYFNIDKWQISQPIILAELYNILNSVNGVLTTTSINIENKYDPTGESYSSNYYDIAAASNITPGIIYTPADPSIFEVKNLNTDIYGKIK